MSNPRGFLAMRLSEQDASFLYTETASSPMQTAGIAVIEGELSFDEVFRHYATRIHLVPRLRQRLVFVPMNLTHPKWVDDPDFAIGNHIVHHEMPQGSTVEDAVDAIAVLNEGVMDRSRPMWKFFVVTGVKDRTLVLQQIHHAMIDGASAVQMSTLLLDFAPDAENPEPPEEPWEPAPLPTAIELVTEALQENANAALSSNPLALLSSNEQTQDHLRRGFSTMTRFFTEPAITAPWNASLLSAKRKLVYSVQTFAEFREIRRAFGGTINDVALTVVTEGAMRYLVEHGESTQNQKFRLMCPVNVRTEDEAGALGNKVSAIFPMFPASPLNVIERHQVVCEETTRIKENEEAQAMTLMQESSISIPAVAMAPLLLVGTPFDPTRFAATNPPPVLPNIGGRPPSFGVNFVLTNVPGVQVPQYIAGHEMLLTLGLMMMAGNMGLGIAVGSYNQQMIFNFTADPRLLPDLNFFSDLVDDAFSELLAEARKQNEAAVA
jgi:WS/DGAT/MGAT family acyltransferase